MTFSRRSFVLMSLSSLSLAACKRGAALLDLAGSTMGTTYNVVAVDQGNQVDKKALHQAIEANLSNVNALMSNWDAGSEVSRFNASSASAPMAVSAELAELIGAANEVNALSQGQFDLTLGPVIEAWGFGAKGGHANMPAPADLASVMETVGQDRLLTLANGQLSKANPDTQIYLSSIGKGFGVDQVADTMKGFGINDFMIEIGGDLYVSGLNPEGTPWQIGIESPDALSAQAYRVAQVSNLGMATSGDYRNYFEKDGQRYSHIIDANTGRPITHQTASVTVLAENAMLADAWATGLLALGAQRGLEIANDLNLAAMFIDRDASAGDSGFTAYSSTAFEQLQA